MEVAIISVGMSVQDAVLTMFIIFPSSNECKAYLTLAPFTVVSAYLVKKAFFGCERHKTHFDSQVKWILGILDSR